MGIVISIGDDVGALSIIDEQLIAFPRDEAVPPRKVPCEDVDLVVLDPVGGQRLNVRLLRKFAYYGTTVLVTDERHNPAGIFLPLYGTASHGNVFEAQFTMSKPRAKRAWQAIVVQKVRNQAAVLGADSAAGRHLLTLAKRVQSGDATNVEAQAARAYWAELLGGTRREGGTRTGVNGALDYGYAIVRSLVARAVVATGLHPAVAVHHSNLRNNFALVDDLMEPLRPFVDRHIMRVVPKPIPEALTPDVKRAIVGVVLETAELGGLRGPLPEVTERYADGFRRYCTGAATSFALPGFCPDERDQ